MLPLQIGDKNYLTFLCKLTLNLDYSLSIKIAYQYENSTTKIFKLFFHAKALAAWNQTCVFRKSIIDLAEKLRPFLIRFFRWFDNFKEFVYFTSQSLLTQFKPDVCVFLWLFSFHCVKLHFVRTCHIKREHSVSSVCGVG